MVVSALVFGGAHVVNTNWSLAPAGLQAAAAVVGTATLGGLLFAWVAYRWDSIWPAIGLHAGLNLAWDLTQGDSGRAIMTARVASVVIALLITWRMTRVEGRGQTSGSGLKA
jgi:membrane protease YdiL (CAAX protease family)